MKQNKSKFLIPNFPPKKKKNKKKGKKKVNTETITNTTAVITKTNKKLPTTDRE